MVASNGTYPSSPIQHKKCLLCKKSIDDPGGPELCRSCLGLMSTEELISRISNSDVFPTQLPTPKPQEDFPLQKCILCGQSFPATFDHFYPGKRLSNGEISLRKSCKECMRAQSKKYRAKASKTQQYNRTGFVLTKICAICKRSLEPWQSDVCDKPKCLAAFHVPPKTKKSRG
jgi:hypothetical protein